MKTKWVGGNALWVKLQPGDKIRESLKKIAADEKLANATFNGLGQAKQIRIGFFNGKGYDFTTFEANNEVLSLTGNIAWDDEQENKPIIHMHIVFSGPDFKVIGGHFDEAVVTGVIELEISARHENVGKTLRKHGLDDLPFKTLDI